MKEWQERIYETIRFIRTADVPTNADKRAAVAKVLQFMNDSGTIPEALSRSMSQGHLWAIRNRDEKQGYRQYRRAIILIRAGLHGDSVNTTLAEVEKILDDQLCNKLGQVLGRAVPAVVLDTANALQKLISDPEKFLEYNKIAVSSTPSSGTYQFDFFFDETRGKYALQPVGGVLRGVGINVFSVGVTPYPTVSGNLGTLAGAVVNNTVDLVLTTQLTGCSFVYQVAGNNMRAMHIWPQGAIKGEDLCRKLGKEAKFANGLSKGHVMVFGPSGEGAPKNYDPPLGYAYIVGVKEGNAWKLHAQQYQTAEEPTHWRVPTS